MGNGAAAAASFHAAVAHNPLAADAWLGLHAAGQLQGQAIEAMHGQTQSFGAMRTKLQTPLSSRFQVGSYVNFRLETPRDLWLAKAAKFLWTTAYSIKHGTCSPTQCSTVTRPASSAPSGRASLPTRLTSWC
ncbi:hypothetical protein [Streptomyces sp. NPDC003077]|uniref:hypothetical protein n=1 Tax=Streptomyces sp. NPDC003077 TaxID=3154443 RepID=UPI0033B01759